MNVTVVAQLAAVFGVGFILPIVPVFPVRLAVLIPLVAAEVNPVLVVLAASLGAAIGTVPLYAVTRTARHIPSVQGWMERGWIRRLLLRLEGRVFLATFLFALLPLPDQLMSVVGGLKSYPVSRMALAFFLGRLPYFSLLAYIGASQRSSIQAGSEALLRWIGL